MSDRDELAPSATEPTAAEVGERVTAVLAAAEAAASAIRREAKDEAQRVHRAAEGEAERYAEEKKREADDLLARRLTRIADVSDGLVERVAGIVAQLDEAEDVKHKLQALVSALGTAAEELAQEMSPADRPALSVVRSAERTAETESAEARTASKERAEPRSTANAAGEPPEGAHAPVRREPADAMSALDRLKAAAQPRGAPTTDRRGRFSREEPAQETPADPSSDELLGARLVALQMAVAGSEREEVERHLRNAFQVKNPGDILDEVFGKTDIKR